MEKKLTPVGIAIQELIKRRDTYSKIPVSGTGKILREECIRSMNEAIDILTLLLPEEKHIIKDAHYNGGCNYNQDPGVTPEEFFTNTYRQK